MTWADVLIPCGVLLAIMCAESLWEDFKWLVAMVYAASARHLEK